MSGEFSNKESLEAIEGIKVLAIGGKKIAADGKVNAADIPAALELVQKMPTVLAGVQGADQIPKEVKDYSPEELQQVGAAFVQMVIDVKNA